MSEITGEAVVYLRSMVAQAQERHPGNPLACKFKRDRNGNALEIELSTSGMIEMHGTGSWILTELGLAAGRD